MDLLMFKIRVIIWMFKAPGRENPGAPVIISKRGGEQDKQNLYVITLYVD